MEKEAENQQTPPFTIKLTSHFHNLLDQNNQRCFNNGEISVFSLVTGLLTIENYVTWTRAMKRASRAKKKLGFVDGGITKPLDPNDPSWKLRKDVMI